MAKSRAQRKAEKRRRQQLGEAGDQQADQSRAQHDTQVPESPDVVEAELAERGADLEALTGKPDAEPEAPAPSRADVGRPGADPDAPGREAEEAAGGGSTRRERKRAERERQQRAKESERRRAPRDEPVERQRGRVSGFIVSCWAELKRVQWPDRETLIQASAVTLVFIAIMATYLGVLDAIFNFVIQRVL